MLQAVPDLELTFRKEDFPRVVNRDSFGPLFHGHGMEVRGKPFELDYKRYYQIEAEGRLVWIVASTVDHGPRLTPIGYACSFWYRDLHFDERVAADDLWFVRKDFRGSGVGKTVKLMCHAELKKQGVVRIYDAIRSDYNHPTLMQELEFEVWGRRWVKWCQVFPDCSSAPDEDRLRGGAEG